MKTFKKLISILMVAMLVLALASCDLIQDAEIVPVVGTVTDENGKKIEIDGIKSKDIRVGILYSDDYEREDTISHIHAEAFNTMRGTYAVADPIPKNKIDINNENLKNKVRDSVISCVKESGCNVVLSTDPAFTQIIYDIFIADIDNEDDVKKEDYQNIAFTCLDNTGKFESTENFNCFYPSYEEAYVLAGIAAASKGGNNIALTESNNAFKDAFELGVKAVNPSAKVVDGETIDTYGTIVTNWHVYYLTLIESLTLGTFDDMGNYNGGIENCYCDFQAGEDYTSEKAEDKMSEARAKFNDGTWDITKPETIKF